MRDSDASEWSGGVQAVASSNRQSDLECLGKMGVQVVGWIGHSGMLKHPSMTVWRQEDAVSSMRLLLLMVLYIPNAGAVQFTVVGKSINYLVIRLLLLQHPCM